MDAKKILQADVLDIIFEGRNKEYGAYNLRKTYNKRLSIAIAVMISLLALLFTSYLLAGTFSARMKPVPPTVDDVILSKAEDDHKAEPPPPPPKIDPPRVEMRQFTAPVIVKTEVDENEKPPEQKELVDAKISNINQHGETDDGLTPPVDISKGVVAAPTKDDREEDEVFKKVEIESSYPGGTEAWARYLNKTLNYPEEAINGEIQGVVTVQFIVDKEGKISDVQAVSGPTEGGLREEAIRVITRSGKWTPAIQNGRSVKSYKRQPIVFKLASQ
ncbi:MAG TPA: TonB family protein [Puia sp.]|nr:TonB family protein [Puia sp.]